MKVTPRNVSVKEIFDGFEDKGDDGVFALGGSLSIRPPYQREFVYSPSQSESVVQTVLIRGARRTAADTLSHEVHV